jgi:hypothetical protein
LVALEKIVVAELGVSAALEPVRHMHPQLLAARPLVEQTDFVAAFRRHGEAVSWAWVSYKLVKREL